MTEGGGRGCYDGEEGMEPGSGVSRFRHYMGAVSGWECCDGEEGSRGLDGQFERAFALFCFLACMVVARRALVSYDRHLNITG